MQKASSRPLSWRSRLIFLPAALVLTADQITKVWIRSHLLIGETLFEAGIFNITRVTPNTGAAFGLFPDGAPVLTIVSFIFVIIFLLYVFVFYHRFPLLDNGWHNLALGLILGGTVGNLVDRLNISLGGVTDFIGVGWWPSFNVADSAITVGALLLTFSILMTIRSGKRTPA